MITETKCKGALLNLLSPRKEIFHYVNPTAIGQNDFLHTVYFFTISDNRLFNVSPLVAGIVGLAVTEVNRVSQRGAGDWPIQLVNALKQKLEDPEIKFLSLNEALPAVQMDLTVRWGMPVTPPPSRLNLTEQEPMPNTALEAKAYDIVDQSQADDAPF